MSIQVCVGHTGERLLLDPDLTTTVDALRAWIQTQVAIQPRNQILLTAQGKQVRTQTLLTEHELFVFDSSRLTSTSSPSSSLASPEGSDFNPGIAPDSISNQNDLQAWQHLFRLRRNWASGLLTGCEAKARHAEKYQDEQAVIERSLGVAVASLQQHIKSAEQKFATVGAQAEDVIQEQDAHASTWEANLESLRSIPAKTEFTRFIHWKNTSSRRMSQQANISTLHDFVDSSSMKKAAGAAKNFTTGFAQRVVKLRNDLEAATRDTDELLQVVDQITASSRSSNTSEPQHLLEEIELVVKKMASDLEHVHLLPGASQSISQASKMALLHTRNYLPNLSEYCLEMNNLVHRTRQSRNDAAASALEHMRTLSSVESVLAQLYQDLKTVEAPQDDQNVFGSLSMISRLPSVYGALLVESVRRREWVAKMRRDAGTLQEEVATYQDEEEKRRKRWIRSVDDIVKPEALVSSVLGIELNLQNEGGGWPTVTREELHDYLRVLSDVYGQCPVTEAMDQAIKDLDKPTRKQIKHAKAFKNGSMHEAAFGDTSLFLRGDEQHKALRETNTRLEEELKGQKSRVRKLEDLLHRQSHIARAGSGEMFSPQGGFSPDRNYVTPSPLAAQLSDDSSRSGLIKHQRNASIQGIEEKKLARRVVDLEAELQAARDEATGRKNSDVEAQKQVDEAISTKKDLMENMEAQQREFATERRHLEQELAETKDRIEEIENELERLVGSRDDERSGIDAKIATFEEEIARLKEDVTGHAARAAAEQAARKAVERKMEQAEQIRAETEAEVQRLRAELEHHQESDAERMQLLATAHAHLAPGIEAPNDIGAVAMALEDLARRSATHVKDLQEAVAIAKSENESLRASNERLRGDLASGSERQTELEAQVRQAWEQVSAETAKAQSLEQQLSQAQEELRVLRTKFADGETGSEVLRQRVADEEARAGKLSSDLAEAKSHINSLDVEIMRLQKKHTAYHATAEVSAARLQKRAEHAKELSLRLFAQHSRLSRLLERLGLAVTYQEDNLVIERASKLGASAAILDPQSQMNRTVSLTSPPPTRKPSGVEEPSNLSTLHWSEAQTVEDETERFAAFLHQISRFNIDTFSDAVVKRLRDFEYTARKYNKEAKESTKRADAYKERSVKLRTEAHSKIAVKDFKEGDLALFLPTRGQAKGAWAAFNVGCPHYFLAEKEGMRLGSRDFIVARISKIEQRVVDLSKTLPPGSLGDISVTGIDNDNPFGLSDGLTWWMVHATEERGAGGAPATPGLGKSTVAAANVDATGSIRIKRSSKGDDASKHLNKSLDSRRSSSASKKSVAGATVPVLANANASGSSPSSLLVDAGHRGGNDALVPPARPLPQPISTSFPQGNGNGLGIISREEPPVAAASQSLRNDQISRLASPEHRRTRTPSPKKHQTNTLFDTGGGAAAAAAAGATRQRSQSPSKSIRSLQRHLEPRGSSRSPVKGPSPAKKPQVWESLWEGEFSLESPSKTAK